MVLQPVAKHGHCMWNGPVIRNPAESVIPCAATSSAIIFGLKHATSPSENRVRVMLRHLVATSNAVDAARAWRPRGAVRLFRSGGVGLSSSFGDGLQGGQNERETSDATNTHAG